MNAIYPYIHSAGEEIKWSLRSLEKYTDLEPVIIGEKPEWYTGRFIPFPRSKHKITNVYFKIRRACLEKKISSTFLLMNDDIFLLEKMKKVHYVTGKIEELWSEYEGMHGMSYYTQCLRQTVLYVGTSWNYETHTPMWMDKKGFMQINPDLFIDNPPLFRTMYGSGSKLRVEQIINGETLRGGEAKYYKHLNGKAFYDFIKGKPCFSTPDRVNIQDELNNLYPEPSKWETF